jgi:hypothetical protein
MSKILRGVPEWTVPEHVTGAVVSNDKAGYHSQTAPEVTTLEAGSCANSFHNGSRSVVWCGGKCHDLGHGKLVECMGRDRPCSLGRIALTSVID